MATPEQAIASANVAATLATIPLQVAQTVASIKDQTKRREFEQKLAMLSQQEQANLNRSLLQAKTDTERMTIIAQAITSIKLKQIEQAGKDNTLQQALIVLAAVVVLIGAVFFISKV